jgi:catalase
VGKKTPVVTRFSTTALESGSSEMYRDMKGMAVRFFTEQGNWDLVNLSLPIFFIRDPSKFPSLMHASRRDPKTNLLNPNLWWDWVCKNPESLHLTLILWGTFGGNFFNWRTMNGYSNHPL